MSVRPLVFKFGGELLEDRSRLARLVSVIARTAQQGVPLVIVHGGGKEIDAALKPPASRSGRSTAFGSPTKRRWISS